MKARIFILLLVCFSSSGIVYALKSDAAYQLYAPSTGFEPYHSLQYFNDKNSLMSYELQSDEKFLRDGNRTLEVLFQPPFHPFHLFTKTPYPSAIRGEG